MREYQAEKSKKSDRSFLPTDVKTWLLFVATLVVLVWLARTIWEDSTPQNLLIRELRSRDPADRLEAARQLSIGIKPGQADKIIRALSAGMRDEDVEVRAACTRSLGSVVGQLLDSWKSDPAALRANQPLVSTTSRKLLNLLKNGEDLVKTEALMALTGIHSHRIQKSGRSWEPLSLGFDPSDEPLPRELRVALLESLGDRSPEVRAGSASLLGELGPSLSRDIPTELLNTMNDPVDLVRARAASACAKYHEGIMPLLPDLFTRLEQAKPPYCSALENCLLEGLRSPDPSLVPFLRDRLRSPSAYVRACAAFLLGKIGPEAAAATPELLQVLSEPFKLEKPERPSHDYQPDPPRSAMWALGKFPPTTEIVDGLVKILRSDVPVHHDTAAGYLARMGPVARKAIPTLIETLQNDLKNSGHQSALNLPYALGQLAPRTDHSDAAIAVLIEALRSKDASMRMQAAEALCRFGPQARPALPGLKGLTHDSTMVPGWRQEVGLVARKAIEVIDPASSSSSAPPR